MKCILFPGNQEIRIDAANLEEANLSEYNCLELHLLDSAAVVIPGEMTGKELLQASQSLQRLASELLMVIVKACAPCDSCGREDPCELMTDTIMPDVAVPYEELIEAGIDPDMVSHRQSPGSAERVCPERAGVSVEAVPGEEGGKQMSNQVFKQNLDDKKGPQPGGPYLIQMLFKEPVDMPDKDEMTAVMEKHIGAVECFCRDKKMAGFAALDHIAEFQDGKCPVQLMVMKCDKFKGKGFDAFLLSQMWDCQQDRERIFRECRYQVVATDMLTAALPALERANLDADFVEALAELYPTCEAFYFQNCGKLLLAEDVRSHQIVGSDRFIRFGVNVRFFNIEGTEDMLIDTVGMSTLFLPDLQYHFHDMDPNWVVNHAYNVASYILEHDNPIQDGETVDGVADGQMSREIQWKCQYEDALIQPPRGVLDINMGEFAAGQR